MIEMHSFIELLENGGYNVASGVPCSNISSLFLALENIRNRDRLLYIPATTEGEALAIAAGSWLAGKKAVVLCQNSGIGNMINPLASLNAPYSIPALLFVSMRGALGFHDEPQHEIMGRETKNFLELASVKVTQLPSNSEAMKQALYSAEDAVSNRRCVAYLIPPQTIQNVKAKVSVELEQPTLPVSPARVREYIEGRIISRFSAIQILQDILSRNITIATTGHTCRDLCATGDKENYFYMAGSMGHAAALGLGVAVNTKKPIIVLDGDGALLMKLGSCATIGRQAPSNLVHIVLDNGQFESTGGQSTNAKNVDFSRIAQACNYRQVWRCQGREAIDFFSKNVDLSNGPTFVHLLISPSTEKANPRPMIALDDMAARFRRFIMQKCESL